MSNATKTPFQKLTELCPYFVLTNKTSIPQVLQLVDDSMQINPGGSAKVKSTKMINMPDKSVWTIHNPTLEQLIAAGIVTVAPSVGTVVAPSQTTTDTSSEDTPSDGSKKK